MTCSSSDVLVFLKKFQHSQNQLELVEIILTSHVVDWKDEYAWLGVWSPLLTFLSVPSEENKQQSCLMPSVRDACCAFLRQQVEQLQQAAIREDQPEWELELRQKFFEGRLFLALQILHHEVHRQKHINGWIQVLKEDIDATWKWIRTSGTWCVSVFPHFVEMIGVLHQDFY